MLLLTLRNLRAYASRLVATATAVVVGVGFLAAGLMLTEAMKDSLDGNVEQQYRAVDVAIRPAGSIEGLGAVVPPQVIEAARAAPGVVAAEGEVTAPVRVLDDGGDVVASRAVGRAWLADGELNPLRVTDGRAPRSSGEVALDVTSAADAGVGVGDRARIATPQGQQRFDVVGLTRFGDLDRLDDGGTVSFSAADASELLNGGVPGAAEVLVRTEHGRGDEVRRRLAEELPPTVDVIDGERFREIEQEQASGFVDLLRPALQGFAYVALFVAAFVIFNTFSVVVTQRFRELALVRAVGGTPAQVRRGLLTEGLVIGVLSSVAGLAAGAMLALLVQAVLGAFDVELPGAGVALTLPTVLLCVGVGTAVTVVSVAIPAFRAGRTKPVEAMRDSEVDTSGTSRVRAVIGGVALVVALVLLVGTRVIGPRWYVLAPGGLLLFVGLVVGGPLLARLFARLLGPVLGRFGVTGRLAVDNTVRNPRRTATTANALVIGLFLVTLVTVAGDALKNWTVEQLNLLSSSDFIVAGSGGPVDPDLVERIAEVDGVEAAAPVRTTSVLNARNQIVLLSGADVEQLRRTTGIEVVAGSLDDVASGAGVALVDLGQLGGGGGGGSAGPGEDRQIADLGGRVGDVLPLVDQEGTSWDVPVVATLEPKIDTLFLGTLASEEAFATLAGERPVTQVFVRADPNRLDAVGARLDDLVEDYSGVEVAPGNFIGAAVAQIFDFLIGTVNALLGMSVVIALIGVVNTLTLSILERRRELGMVRALGMTRGQVAATIRLEGLLIGTLGTLVGVAAGLLLGWVLIGSLDDADIDIDLAVNWARIGLIAVAGVAVGLLASLLPARRALRVDVLEATRSL